MRRVECVILLLAVAACGGDEAGGTPAEADERRALAARHACVAQELAREAQEDLGILEQTIAAAGGAGGAATAFARAFAQHAELRAAAYAQTDSALNHSAAPADSTRHMAAASRIEIRTPPPGSVEANVMQSYEEKLAAILTDTDHPCNWKHELDK